MLRFLALGLLCGVLAVPLLWSPRGEGFEHARLEFLLTLLAGQIVLVPPAFLIGIVLVARRTWARPPGYVLGAVTAASGVVVVAEGWAMGNGAEGRAGGIGDPDDVAALVFVISVSGLFMLAVGAVIVLLRWVGYDGRTAPVRRGRAEARRPTRR